MIKTIIFDFGDVLVRDTTKTLEKKYHFNFLPKAKQKAYIRAFHQSEMGKLTSNQLLQVMHKQLVPKMSPKDIEQFIIHTKILPPWQLALKLAKKYQVIIFSNNQKLWPRKMAQYLKIDFFIFPWVNSSYVGMRKPNVRFYKYVLKKYHLQPEECVFVDDKLKNIAPAKELGIKTFHYQNNSPKLVRFLKNLGISI